MDLSILQDFKMDVSSDWSSWQFTNEEYKDFPLSFFNKFGKSVKFCNLSTIQANQSDSEFVVVQGNLKTKSKDHISKSIAMNDKTKRTQSWIRQHTKKQKKNFRGYSNQYKTKFREITVKNDWELLKDINKRALQEAPKLMKEVTVELIKKKGQLRYLNPKVDKIQWNPTGFKENQAYTIDHHSTMEDNYLAKSIGASLFEEDYQEKYPERISVVCSLQFLLALMTVRGGQYPWTIQVSKQNNVIMLDRYRTSEGKDFSYLDMFTPNQNTTTNMPRDENRIRENCTTGTRMTKVFKDLLASGDVCENEELEQEKEHNEDFGDVDEDEEELDELKKYIKIAVDNIDIFTSVSVNGVKRKPNGDQEPVLIRAFVETGTDGGWIEDIKKTQGTLVFQEYYANSCSLQKWICEARLAGVEAIKCGFIGFSKQKPFIVNVQETTVSNLEKCISFKEQDCYPILKHIISQIASEPNGQYILTRNSYTPLSLKLYKLPYKERDDDEMQEAD